MEKIVICIMGQDCEKFLPMCLESVKEADDIIYCDGGSTDGTMGCCIGKATDIIENKYDQEDPTMNGKQRNFYLKYLKKNYPKDWCLCLDADEVVEDLTKIKEFIQIANKGIYSVKMRHLIGDLAHEDSIQPVHFVLNRLFKISEAVGYPEVEHPVLQGNTIGNTLCTTIWHLAYCPNMWSLKKRYENHLAKSNMHSPEYLKQWYYSHLFGGYPKKPFNPVELPKVILDEFGVDKDELYFAGRGLETKHFIDAIHWRDYFKCKNAVEWGCGRGPRVFSLNSIGVETDGWEYSKFAVLNALHPAILQGDLMEYHKQDCITNSRELCIAYDVLEHIPYEKIDNAINKIIDYSKKNILISVPFKGTPNCENDPTHIIKEDRGWWIKQFTDKGLKQVITPEHFLFKEQILIFEK